MPIKQSKQIAFKRKCDICNRWIYVGQEVTGGSMFARVDSWIHADSADCDPESLAIPNTWDDNLKQ